MNQMSEFNIISPQDLEMVGLSAYESKVYLSLLTLQLATAKEIIEESSVPSGRVYEVLSSLEGKGLIERQDSFPKKFLVLDPKTAIGNLMEIKAQEFQQVKEHASILESKLNHIFHNPSEESSFWSVALDQEKISKFGEKLLLAKEEALIYLNRQASVRSGSNKQTSEDFMDILQILVENKVKVKVLIGGSTKDQFTRRFVGSSLPFLPVLNNVEIGFTSVLTNTFDVIDFDKILLKVSNPVDPEEYIASIYLWTRELAKRFRDRFLDIWNDAEKLTFEIQ